MIVLRLLSFQGAHSESIEHAVYVEFMFQFKIRLMLESISVNQTRSPICSLYFRLNYKNNLTQLFPDPQFMVIKPEVWGCINLKHTKCQAPQSASVCAPSHGP